MANVNLSRAEGRAIRGFVSWVRLTRIARLGLGGVIIGSFAGIYAGAVLGLCYAAWVGHLSPALDGALLGGAASALLGGGYGTVLGLTERRNAAADARDDQPLAPVASPCEIRPIPSDQRPPAGHLEPDRTPAKEHAHVR